jgi:hypothetical protein
MSLDVSLYLEQSIEISGTGIFVRDGGRTRELSAEEARVRYPDAVIEERKYYTDCVYDWNITHNLVEMAEAAGLYKPLWRPYMLLPEWDDSAGIDEYEFEQGHTVLAKDIMGYIAIGYSKLISDPEHYKTFNPSNGWGSYEGLVEFTYTYLKACVDNPLAIVKVDR